MKLDLNLKFIFLDKYFFYSVCSNDSGRKKEHLLVVNFVVDIVKVVNNKTSIFHKEINEVTP